MSLKSGNSKTRSSGNVCKADQLRQEKQKKVEENNRKVSQQLESSANSWQHSMEQVRKIAQKTHDSSQILDNVFTENDHDRSDMEVEYERHEGRSNHGDRPPYSVPPRQQMDASFQPLSQYASCQDPFTTFLRSRKDTNFNANVRPFPFQQATMTLPYRMTSWDQNTYLPPNYQASGPRPAVYGSPGIRPWQVAHTNQSNSFSLRQNMFPHPRYPPSSQRPPFFQYGIQGNPLTSSPYEDNSPITPIKRYLSSLLDKIEMLNHTVQRLTHDYNDNNGRQWNGRQEGWPHQGPGAHHCHNQYCGHVQARPPRRPPSCVCHDQRRPPSSASHLSQTRGSLQDWHQTARRPQSRYGDSLSSSCHHHHHQDQDHNQGRCQGDVMGGHHHCHQGPMCPPRGSMEAPRYPAMTSSTNMYDNK